jgi:hypothetical protein
MNFNSDTNYVIFNVEEIDKIDFDQVEQKSVEILRLSIDETKTFVYWWGSITPAFVNNLTTKEGVYTYEEVLPILQGIEWNVPYNQEILP